MVTNVTFLAADAAMDGGQIVAPVRPPTDPGTGRVRLFLDQASGNLLVLGEFTPLSSALAPRNTTDAEHPSAAHLHAGAPGDNGGVIRHLHTVQNADLLGSFGTDSVLTPALAARVTAGNSYALIHTQDNYGGEIRGQITGFAQIAGLLGDATAETIAGTRGADVVMALAGDDRVMGGAGDDVLSGGAGNDVLAGGSGADLLSGGQGNDVYVVADTADRIWEFDGEGRDRVIASVDYVLGDVSIEDLTLTGAARRGTGNAAANTVSGNALDNVLSGGDGNDLLRGGAGDDALTGGAGADMLVGGAGADIFAFGSAGDSAAPRDARDTIADFASGEDRIDLSALGATVFVGAAGFSGTAGEVRAFASARATYVLADVDGDRAADLIVNLRGAMALSETDFIF